MIKRFCDLCNKRTDKLYTTVLYKGFSFQDKYECCYECTHKINKYIKLILKSPSLGEDELG